MKNQNLDKKLTTIIKVKNHENNYDPISRSLSQDERLSFKARGLMLYLLSLPDNWTIKLSHLTTVSPQGIKAVQSSFKELRKFGYAKLDWIKDEDNKIRSQYFISELSVETWIETPIEEAKKGNSYTISAFQQKFTRNHQASTFLEKTKRIFIEQFAITFYAKFTFDRKHTQSLKQLLLAIIDNIDEHFGGQATHEQILKGFKNLLSKAVQKCKKPKQFTPSYILHILHTLRSHNPILD